MAAGGAAAGWEGPLSGGSGTELGLHAEVATEGSLLDALLCGRDTGVPSEVGPAGSLGFDWSDECCSATSSVLLLPRVMPSLSQDERR